MTNSTILTLTAASILAATSLTSLDAEACGGCFVPPAENTQVTGHRMVLSIDSTKTTLIDQIEYAGNPAEFAWVLPIKGTVDLGISSDLVFNQLGQITSVNVAAPVRNCPQSNCPNDNWGTGPSASAGSTTGTGGGGVTVIAEKVVGPYETVQLSADDPQALNDWLELNNYSLPDDVKPIINAYVLEGYNFLAMRLAPGEGVERMAPIRITTAGANPTLPLRMVAAGTGAQTLLTLWVISEGRYEPSNFPFFEVPRDQVLWDYSRGESNYTDLREQLYGTHNGYGWQVESSVALSIDGFRNVIDNVLFQQPESSGYYDPSDDNPYVAAEQRADEDLDAIFDGIDLGAARVTRLRGQLGRAALANDLQLTASMDQREVSTQIQTTDFIGNQPACPKVEVCDDEGNPWDPTDNNGAGDDGVVFGCSATPATTPELPIGGGLAIAGLGIAFALRRRR